MSRETQRPYERKAMLAAFRQQRGPRPATVDALWERLVDEGVTVEEPTSRAVPVTRMSVVLAAAAALAAAFVLGWWLRGAPVWSATVAEPADMANRDAQDARSEGHSTQRAPRAVPRAVVPPQPEPTAVPIETTPVGPPADGTPPPDTALPATGAGSPAADDAIPSPSAASPSSAPVRRDRAPQAPEPKSEMADTVPDESTAPPAPADTLAEEAVLVRRARRALAADDATKALRIAGEYRERFPRGTLVEEIDALQTMARCRTQPETRASLRRAFARQYPSSMQQPGVDRACPD